MRERRQYDEPEILRRLHAGESQRAVGRALDLNPVTVGYVARRHGITYPRAVRQAEARRGHVLRQPERSWQAQIMELADLLHWRAYHTHNSQHSVAGFPDTVLARAPRLLIAELKVDAELMPAQEAWLAELARCDGVEVFVWYPQDVQVVTQILEQTTPWTGATRIWPGESIDRRRR